MASSTARARAPRARAPTCAQAGRRHPGHRPAGHPLGPRRAAQPADRAGPGPAALHQARDALLRGLAAQPRHPLGAAAAPHRQRAAAQPQARAAALVARGAGGPAPRHGTPGRARVRGSRAAEIGGGSRLDSAIPAASLAARWKPTGLENAVFEWEEGYRRLQAARSDPARHRLLGRAVLAVEDELRKRLGSRFTIAELARLYRESRRRAVRRRDGGGAAGRRSDRPVGRV